MCQDCTDVYLSLHGARNVVSEGLCSQCFCDQATGSGSVRDVTGPTPHHNTPRTIEAIEHGTQHRTAADTQTEGDVVW